MNEESGLFWLLILVLMLEVGCLIVTIWLASAGWEMTAAAIAFVVLYVLAWSARELP